MNALEYYYANKSNPDFVEKYRVRAAIRYKNFTEEQKAQHRERNRMYKAANPDKFAGYERKRRALKNSLEHSEYTIEDVLNKYGSICYICQKEIDLSAPSRTGRKGWEKGLHIDHYVAIANGGADTLENVRPSHGLCNTIKNKRNVEEMI